MKIKRFTKLALAGVGLAATAATLTTSTYAWYVTNSKVEATGVSGQVVSGEGGALYIAYNNDAAPSTYGTKVTFDSTAGTELTGKYRHDSLLPQTRAKSDLNGYFSVADLMKGYDGADDNTAKYNYAAAAYNGTLESNTYYVDGESGKVKATGVYDSTKKYYEGNTDTVAQDPTTYAAPNTNTADDVKITAATYNESLRSTQYSSTRNTFTAAEGVYDSNKTYFDKDDTIKTGDWVNDKGFKTKDTSIEFKFWLKSGETKDVNVTTMIDNISNAITAQQLTIKNTGYTGNLEVGDPLIADAVKALRMQVSIFEAADTNYTTETIAGSTNEEKFASLQALMADHEVFTRTGDGSTTPYSYALVPATIVIGDFDASATYVKRTETKKVYDVSSFAMNSKGLAAYTTATSTAAVDYDVPFTNMTTNSWDANMYYYNLMNGAAYNTNTSTGKSELASTAEDPSTETGKFLKVSLTQNVDTLLTFKIWLEGSDADCWDSCKGQAFTFDFSFEL